MSQRVSAFETSKTGTREAQAAAKIGTDDRQVADGWVAINTSRRFPPRFVAPARRRRKMLWRPTIAAGRANRLQRTMFP
jgi:hypothetical protein